MLKGNKMESETDLFEGALFPLVAMFFWTLMAEGQ